MTRRPLALAPLTPWITEAALAHGPALAGHVAQRLDITPRRATGLLRKLQAAQWLHDAGTPRRPRWQPGPLRQVVRRYALDGLQEDLPWRRDFAACFALPAHVQRIAQHAFTELLNNAIDHSGGSTVTVSMRQTPLQMQLLVSDDGVGLFQRIEGSFGIADTALAMLELAKGKLTSDPARHRGHGLFFAARLADVFDLHANAHAFQCRQWEGQRWRSGRPAAQAGTSVYLAVALDTQRTVDSVLRAHSHDGAGYGFARTRVPLALLAGEGAALASRAEARRVVARLASFERAEIDFTGIGEVGQAFADELLRVAKNELPGVMLAPIGMAPRVAAMLASV